MKISLSIALLVLMLNFSFIESTKLNLSQKNLEKKGNLKVTEENQRKILLNSDRRFYNKTQTSAENFLLDISHLVLNDFKILNKKHINGITFEILKDMIHSDRDFGNSITDEELKKKFKEYDISGRGELDKITYSGILSEFMLAKAALRKLNKYFENENSNNFYILNITENFENSSNSHYNHNHSDNSNNKTWIDGDYYPQKNASQNHHNHNSSNSHYNHNYSDYSNNKTWIDGHYYPQKNASQNHHYNNSSNSHYINNHSDYSNNKTWIDGDYYPQKNASQNHHYHNNTKSNHNYYQVHYKKEEQTIKGERVKNINPKLKSQKKQPEYEHVQYVTPVITKRNPFY